MVHRFILLQTETARVDVVLQPMSMPSLRSPMSVFQRNPAKDFAFQRRKGLPDWLVHSEDDTP
jgi:hypothetical protein